MKWLIAGIGTALIMGLLIGGYTYMVTEQANNPALAADAQPLAEGAPFRVQPLTDGPIISTALFPELQAEAAHFGYENINGPTLIRVPDWVKSPLGRYYLYFAHHKGPQIRLAYADSPTGPYTLMPGGPLHVDQTPFDHEIMDPAPTAQARMESAVKFYGMTELTVFGRITKDMEHSTKTRAAQGRIGSTEAQPHIASPEIFIDEENKRFILFYHGLIEGAVQVTALATSEDGIHFTPQEAVSQMTPYFRFLKLRERNIGMAMPGLFYEAEDVTGPYAVRPQPVFDINARHHAFLLEGNTLHIAMTRVGDTPERILVTSLDVSSDNWSDWQPGPLYELYAPTHDWEGADQPVEPSLRSETTVREHALRDPHIFKDDDGRLYMTYAGGGENLIGIVELVPAE